MESVETLKGMIEVVEKDIKVAKRRIRGLEDVLKELHEELFYAENGMKEGQHFMFNGKEYAKVKGDSDISIKAYPLNKNGKVSSVWNYIFRSGYGKIQPLPMRK